MFKTVAPLSVLAMVASFAAVSGANAGIPIAGATALLAGNGQTMPVTFWAQPYPERYVPRRRCPIVRVETPYGWYFDRVCAPTGPVLRRAY
ncbi:MULTISPECIES: hypothetical protein [Bradyrhizobium]|jgi:hypothetical protein|uniref:hypothetical protein n=1 Tax=Bradyrhizobium TaxID=374 RepID=UPI001BA50283|nr:MULTISPECIES: hypothetical protein [Bradyrhizobium]MBR0815963.1 hypothetical protein [Bradyrhizobium diazoefficiens]WOH72276.1 hypothetical protein RX330_28915 [Bradyrhizobium sp. NDS-1]